MGKKDKGKKQDVTAKKAGPKVASKVQPNQSNNTSTRSKANNSQDIVCGYCAKSNSESEWLVQCDNCDGFTHFSCAGITQISEEEPWLCHVCAANLNQTDTTTTDNDSLNGTSNELLVLAVVHNPPGATLEDIPEDSETNQHTSQIEEQNETSIDQVAQSSDQNVTRTRGSSAKSRSKGSKTQTLSSVSSNRRQGIELQRIEEELKLQAELDAETLALKLEAINLKQTRHKKYLADKYKALSVGDGSVISKYTNVTQKSSYVSDWVQTQQNRVTKTKSLDENQLRNIERFDNEIDQMSFDISIPVNKNEIRQFKAMYRTDPPAATTSETLMEKQVRLFKEWRDQNQKVESNTTRVSQAPSSQTIQQDHQPTVSSSVKVIRLESQPKFMKGLQTNSEVQQPKATLSQTANEFKMPPRSRSTLLNERATSVHRHNFDVQKPNDNYVFSRYEMPTRTYVTNSGYENERNGLSSSANDPETSKQPVVSSRANTEYVNSWASKRPVASSRANTEYVNSWASKRPVASSRANTEYVNSWASKRPVASSSANHEYVNPWASKRPVVSSIANTEYVSPWAARQPIISESVNPLARSVYEKRTHNQPEPIISSMENNYYENQYYDRLYSCQNPTSTSMPHQGPYGASERATASTMMVPSHTNSILRQSVGRTLTPSHIASRHAIPKDLPKFSGNPKDWCRFIKRYDNSTDICGYTEDENLERLDKCLLGKARTLVESLLLMPDSVPEIIDTLRERYGRPELIIKIVLDEVRAFPTIKPDKLELLSDYGYAVRNACKQIEDLNLRNYLYSPDLLQDIVEKLPYQTRIDWARYSENLPTVTLREIADWLHKLSRTINRIISEVSTSSNDQKTNVKQENQKPQNPKPESKSGWVYLHDNNKSSESSEKQAKCSICGNNCKSVEVCPKFKGLDVDQRWKSLLDNKLCRKCLKFHKRNCLESKACGVNGCEFKHHSLLHNEKRYSKENSSSATQVATNKGTQSSNNNKSAGKVTSGRSNSHFLDIGELYRIVPVKLYFNGQTVSTYAYLDEGSSFTLMERHTADLLGLYGIPETICLLWTNKVHRQEESENVNLEIAGIMSDEDKEPSVKYQLKDVNVVKNLDLPEQSLPLDKFKLRYKHLRKVPVSGYEKVIPTMLIGLKHARLAVPLETVEGEENGPIATRSRLGWSVYGPVNGTSTGYVNVHSVKKCPCEDRDNDLHKIIKDHFTIENFGVSINSMNMESKENQKALEMLKQFTIRKGNRFETRLLWKNDAYSLPDSYGMARKRLTCVENKGTEVVKVIDDIIKDYLEKGYASKLSSDDLKEKHPRTFYLPIFTVTNPKKPGKIRPVFDAAATVKGTSLNSTLLTGPDLLSPLVNVLRRFREQEIAFTGDIKDMFYRVFINEVDRHSQRFLWRNGDKSREPDVYQFNVMTFGSKCSPSSAQFVKNTNASEYEIEYPRAAKSIIENHYVDDMLDGARNAHEAVKLINEVKFIHSKAGFEIRNFKSNSEEVLKAIGETTDVSKVDLLEGDKNIERVLGMFWETKLDCFMFSLRYTKVTSDILQAKTMPTKREVLRLVMSLFDPLGLISYYVIHAKILLQEVWKTKIGWDEKLPEELAEKWFRWIELLPQVECLKIPRWYSRKLSSETKKPRNELHIFVDAGEDAFAAVGYLRVEDEVSVDCSLIGSKAKVTPLKYLSTPRKELLGGVLGSRLINSIADGLSLKIDRRFIWTDSTTVLIWLHSETKKYSQFVAHRIGEILENTNLSEWRWVPTKLNVSDNATKWKRKPTFDASDPWFTGPEFLKLPESEWPVPKAITPNGTNEEMKLSCSHSKLIIPSIVDASRYSSWSRVVRAIANAGRITALMVAKVRKLPRPLNGPLSQEELINSERRLIRQAQWEGFTEEMVTLVRNEKVSQQQRKPIEPGSSIRDCLPYLDEFGILRVKGRIDSATAVTIDAKRPIILPRNNPVTNLIVLSYHVKFKHHNHESVINELRQRFYIPQIRQVLKGVRWKCKLCMLRRSKPQPPQMADLPAIRFEAGIRPFTYTGIDYFGPMKVKVGRQNHKRWGVIFTCLTIRAVYIDIVPSLDTQSCICCIQDFVNRKGVVQHFYSDNGSNFKGANNELTKELEKLDQQELFIEFTSCYTKWYFNPPETPHMGGIWERLIRTIKTCFYESLPTRTPTEQVLRNLLTGAENIVNSRPLTFIPLNSEEGEALTPNHFILGSSNGMKPPGKFKSDGQYLRDQWMEAQRCINVFWQRFIHEYVPTLTRRAKWFDPVKPLEVGDIVINFDEDAPRNTYIRGRVVETIIGSNNQVRRAKIQFGNGRVLWRSATNLGLLDVHPAPTENSSLNHPKDDRNRGENVGATISNITGPKHFECDQVQTEVDRRK